MLPAVLCYILIDRQMLEKVFCSNIAPSLSFGNHLFCKAEYMVQSCFNQVWALTFEWSAQATWNKYSWTAFWKPFQGKTRRWRRHVCAIFQPWCAICLPMDTQALFFAFCCENWHRRWMNRHPKSLRHGQTCLMVFHAILRQISNYEFLSELFFKL